MRLLLRKAPPVCGFGNAETVAGDLADGDALARLVRGASAVIHMAGAIAAPDRSSFFAINAEGTARLAEAAAQAGVRRFIHISSLAAREPELADYGASKREAEERLRGYQDRMAVMMLRPPAIYGPGDRATLPLFAQMVRRVAVIPGTPTARFSLLYVDDFARAVTAALDGPETGIHEVDAGQPNGYAWPDLLAAAARHEGHKVTPVYLPRAVAMTLARLIPALPLKQGKVRELYHPDWVCRAGSFRLDGAVRFDEGLPLTLAWYRQAGWLPQTGRADKSQSRTDHGERLP